MASNAAPIRYNLRIVTDIATVGPRTLATVGAQSYGTPGAVGTVGVPVHGTKRAYVTTPTIGTPLSSRLSGAPNLQCLWHVSVGGLDLMQLSATCQNACKPIHMMK